MLILVTIIVFALANLMPGDAAMAMFASGDGSITAEAIEQQRENMGLNDPAVTRYFRWLGQLIRGDMGVSQVTFQPVWEMIKLRIGPTVLLMGTSLILSIIIGVALGIFSAVKQYSIADYVLTVISFIGRSVPIFFVGLFMKALPFSPFLSIIPCNISFQSPCPKMSSLQSSYFPDLFTISQA